MASRLSVVLLLAVAVVTVAAQRRRQSSTATTAPATDEWNYRDGSDKVNMRNVADLTQVLDNWRFDILTQMKDMLLKDHQSLLPDYSRIPPLSEALDDLYKEFNALKSHLGDLTEKFVAIEAFIDEVKTGQSAGNGNGNASPAPAPEPDPAPAPGPTRRRVIKRKPAPPTSS